jgi:hypothetical protein
MLTRRTQPIAHPSHKLECFHCTRRATLAIVTSTEAGTRIGYLPICSGDTAVDVLASFSR